MAVTICRQTGCWTRSTALTFRRKAMAAMTKPVDAHLVCLLLLAPLCSGCIQVPPGSDCKSASIVSINFQLFGTRSDVAVNNELGEDSMQIHSVPVDAAIEANAELTPKLPGTP